MDPLWTEVWPAIAELWWIGPTVIGAGAAGWLGLRHERSQRLRRIELDAARSELVTARRDATSARLSVRVARTELARVQAERTASRATSADVAAARRELDRAQRETKAAAATARARRAHVSAARAGLPTGSDPAALPLARLMAAHDAVTARWMDYETDPAKLIAFPAMTDARVPLTAAFLSEQRAVREVRPASAQARITTAQFTTYRDGVARLARAFDAAEAEAWRQARASGSAPTQPAPTDPDAPAPGWSTIAQTFTQTLTQTVIERSAEALARVTAQMPTAASASPSTARENAAPQTPSTEAPVAPEPPKPAERVWPIPSRSSGPTKP